jgi:hypothetical protein
MSTAAGKHAGPAVKKVIQNGISCWSPACKMQNRRFLMPAIRRAALTAVLATTNFSKIVLRQAFYLPPYLGCNEGIEKLSYISYP